MKKVEFCFNFGSGTTAVVNQILDDDNRVIKNDFIIANDKDGVAITIPHHMQINKER